MRYLGPAYTKSIKSPSLSVPTGLEAKSMLEAFKSPNKSFTIHLQTMLASLPLLDTVSKYAAAPVSSVKIWNYIKIEHSIQ